MDQSTISQEQHAIRLTNVVLAMKDDVYKYKPLSSSVIRLLAEQ